MARFQYLQQRRAEAPPLQPPRHLFFYWVLDIHDGTECRILSDEKRYACEAPSQRRSIVRFALHWRGGWQAGCRQCICQRLQSLQEVPLLQS